MTKTFGHTSTSLRQRLGEMKCTRAHLRVDQSCLDIRLQPFWTVSAL